MPRLIQRKGRVSQTTITIASAGDTLDMAPIEQRWGWNFVREFDEAYRKFWAKRGVNVTSHQW